MKKSVMSRNKTLDRKKRASEARGPPIKRSKSNTCIENEITVKNWTLACEEVSCNAYFDYRERFQLVYLPSCTTFCNHQTNNRTLKQMPSYAEESFKTEIRNHMWYEALEVCHMSLTATHYLSSDVLQEVVEIMMNVHEDECSEYPAKYIVDNCKQLLLQNFSTHPPCQDKRLRNCYVNFLTSSMPSKKNTCTNRNNYECNRGIVKYCMNRLECELSADSNDGPMVDKNVPDDLKDTVKGLHWQKQNFEIFECLNREERIKRLFAVLETIIEVFQFDLAIQLSRYLDDESRHRISRCKKLMEHVLWSTNDTVVSGSCLQIMRIFANVIHLQYPHDMVKIITTWLNTMIQTMYAQNTTSNSDYPSLSNKCVIFAIEFYNIIAVLPHDSIVKILEKIEPSYMRHEVGLFYLHEILSVEESCIIEIIKDFLLQRQWKSYQNDNVEIRLSENLFNPPKRVNDKISYLFNKCTSPVSENSNCVMFPKKDLNMKRNRIKADLHHVIYALYITFEASLDAYKLQSVQDTWNALNKQIINGSLLCRYNSYSVSEALKARYKNNLNDIKKLAFLFNTLNKRRLLPQMFNIFSNIRLLEIHM